MFQDGAPLAADLLHVPPAQRSILKSSEQKKEVARVEHYKTFVSEVSKGVMSIMMGPRSYVFSDANQVDLCACIDLIENERELAFDWDIKLYTNPPKLKAPRLPTEKMGAQIGDKAYDEPADDEDLDYDPVERPEVFRNDVHLIQMYNAPYWSLARYALVSVCFDPFGKFGMRGVCFTLYALYHVCLASCHFLINEMASG